MRLSQDYFVQQNRRKKKSETHKHLWWLQLNPIKNQHMRSKSGWTTKRSADQPTEDLNTNGVSSELGNRVGGAHYVTSFRFHSVNLHDCYSPVFSFSGIIFACIRSVHFGEINAKSTHTHTPAVCLIHNGMNRKEIQHKKKKINNNK